MKNRYLLAFAIAIATLTVGGAGAQTHGNDHASHHSSSAAAASDAAEFVAGEVRRVDVEAQKVTLRHGPIPNLGMSDMTMVFHAADPALLSGLKRGDRILFKADRVDGEYRVTAVEPAR